MRTEFLYYRNAIILGFLAGILGFLLTSCGKRTTETVAGPKGDAGAQGPVGPRGAPGVGCTQRLVEATNRPNDPAQYGGSLITCENGSVLITNGAKGDTGDKGSQGDPGANGNDGTNGQDGHDGQNGTPGTLITAIKFCPQYAANSGFPEYGIAFGGQLFAVYWDHTNAWLALVTPGYYASTSTTAPCNFTVNNDGTVTQ